MDKYTFYWLDGTKEVLERMTLRSILLVGVGQRQNQLPLFRP
jgi:hypothetical protein